MMKKVLLVVTLTFTVVSLFAQVNEAAKAQMIKDWERAKAFTDEYMNTVPADKYDFKANDSVRSFAQQLLHLSAGNFALGSAGVGKENPMPRRNLEAAKSANTKDSVAYYVRSSYDFIINGIKALDAAKFEEKTKLFSFEESRVVFLSKCFEHQTHHRGQLTTYIRLMGIKPPNEKLF
jgi:uncharacterized damage-inducible protein DinB